MAISNPNVHLLFLVICCTLTLTSSYFNFFVPLSAPPTRFNCPAGAIAGVGRYSSSCRPISALFAAPPVLAKSNDWAAYLDEANNCIYYFNAKTGESLWEPPPGEDFSALTARPAAALAPNTSASPKATKQVASVASLVESKVRLFCTT